MVAPLPGPARLMKVVILIVEDQQRLAQLLKRNLTDHHYIVECARNCHQAREALCETAFDLIILDLGLPDGDGLDLLREWRENGLKQPVLIMSARDAVEERVRGLHLGADDYLAKPFSFEELFARRRSQLRRQSRLRETVLKYRGIRLDLISHAVSINGQLIELTRREFELLALFMRNPGRVLTRTLISEKIWLSQYDVNANMLDVYMSRLRAKFESTQDGPVFKTVRGVGYRLQ